MLIGDNRCMDYEDYFRVWISGIRDEIVFWNNYVSNEGGSYFYSFEKTVSANRKFELDEDIPKEFYGKKYKFIDVGSGPFSRCGSVSDKVMLNTTAVDPLAYAYNMIKEKFHVDNGILLENGFVELLDKKFKTNTFDMVHMSNSLDHCFSAVDGIYQLLYICKIGGKIILRHHENEAEREKYKGLHQWNLSLNNAENSFIVWREGYRFDICDIFRDYANFELIRDVQEKDGHWVYNKVVMIKKKDILIPANSYYDKMMDIIYQQLMSNITEKTIMREEKVKTQFENRLKKIQLFYHSTDRNHYILKQKGINSISIYGMGIIGKNLEYALSNCGIRVDQKIDQKGADSGCYEAVKLESIDEINSDIIIICINDKNVYKKIKEKFEYVKIYMIDEFLDIFNQN